MPPAPPHVHDPNHEGHAELYHVDIDTEKGKPDDPSKGPWIAVCIATTSRGIAQQPTSSLSLFRVCLPSIARTVEPGYRYRIVVIHDDGDRVFDNPTEKEWCKGWFEDNIVRPLQGKGIQAEVLMLGFENTRRKPGPAFNVMIKAAYNYGASFFYRINDDTEFISAWAGTMARSVEALGFPYGVAGPSCDSGNQKILTHDFTHRTHMEIFNMTYYPDLLADWWMDDWITFVYGAKRRVWLKDVIVKHHTGMHQTRYEVDQSKERFVIGEICKGRQHVLDWMIAQKLPETLIESYRTDDFGEVNSGKVDCALLPKDGSDPTTFKCNTWVKQYNVKVGITWGDMPADIQEEWKKARCDLFVSPDVGV